MDFDDRDALGDFVVPDEDDNKDGDDREVESESEDEFRDFRFYYFSDFFKLKVTLIL